MIRYCLYTFLVSALSLASAHAQQNFSWFGNQIIKNSTETIPARSQYVGIFDVSEASRTRIDVEAAQGEELDTYLLRYEVYEASVRAGRLSGWLENVEGAKVQVLSALQPGRYAVVVQNVSSIRQNVHIRVWNQKL
jgi:hypothetical protein